MPGNDGSLSYEEFMALDAPAKPKEAASSDGSLSYEEFMALPQSKASVDESPERSATDAIKDAGVTALKGAVGLPQALVGVADIPTGGHVGKALEGIGYRPNETQKTLDTWYSPAQQEANRKVHSADGFVDTMQAAIENPSAIATTIGESIPQMIGGAGVARGLMSAGQAAGKTVAPWVAGGIGEGVVGAGSAEESIRGQTPDGLTTPMQSLSAAASGVGTAVLGALGGKLSQKIGLADIDTMLAQGGANAATAAAAKTGFFKQVIGSGISEGTFEELPQSIQEQMWQNFALGKPLTDGVGNAAALGLLSGTAMGGAGGGYNAMVGKVAPVQPPQDTAQPDKNIAAAKDISAAIAATEASITPRSATDIPQSINDEELLNQLNNRPVDQAYVPQPEAVERPTIDIAPDVKPLVENVEAPVAAQAQPIIEQSQPTDINVEPVQAAPELQPTEGQDNVFSKDVMESGQGAYETQSTPTGLAPETGGAVGIDNRQVANGTTSQPTSPTLDTGSTTGKSDNAAGSDTNGILRYDAATGTGGLGMPGAVVDINGASGVSANAGNQPNNIGQSVGGINDAQAASQKKNTSVIQSEPPVKLDQIRMSDQQASKIEGIKDDVLRPLHAEILKYKGEGKSKTGSKVFYDATDRLKAIAEDAETSLKAQQVWFNSKRKVLEKNGDAEAAALFERVAAHLKERIKTSNEPAPVKIDEAVSQAASDVAEKTADVVGAKPKRKVGIPKRMSMLQFVASEGGFNRASIAAEIGRLDDMKRHKSGIFGSPAFRAKGGMHWDKMGERLAEAGYLPKNEHGQYDKSDLAERLNAELDGEMQYTFDDVEDGAQAEKVNRELDELRTEAESVGVDWKKYKTIDDLWVAIDAKRFELSDAEEALLEDVVSADDADTDIDSGVPQTAAQTEAWLNGVTNGQGNQGQANGAPAGSTAESHTGGGQRGSAQGEAQQQAPAGEFALTSQTEEDLREQEARAADTSIADRDAADRASEVPLTLAAQSNSNTGSAVNQGSMFTPDGRASKAAEAKAQPESKPKKAPKKDIRAKLESYFAIGNIIKSDYWGDYDRVESFSWNDGDWHVRVTKVKKNKNNEWVEDGDTRSHGTFPDSKDVVVANANNKQSDIKHAEIKRSESFKQLPDYAQQAIGEHHMEQLTNHKKHPGLIDAEWERVTVPVASLRKENEEHFSQSKMLEYAKKKIYNEGPSVLDRHGVLVDGNHRFNKAIRDGQETIEVFRPKPAQESKPTDPISQMAASVESLAKSVQALVENQNDVSKKAENVDTSKERVKGSGISAEDVQDNSPKFSRSSSTINIDGVERSRLNSNGKPIANTDEALTNFWKWFGDSKVVDEQGRPIAVFHGTNNSFDEFSKEKVQSRFPYSFGLYFTTRTQEASVYADSVSNAAEEFNPKSKFAIPSVEGGNVIPVYLKAVAPLEITTDMSSASMEADTNRYDIIAKLVEAKKSGSPYDSVIIKRQNGDEYDGQNIIVFNPSQIKSSIGNTGDFSKSNNSILQSKSTPAQNTHTVASATSSMLEAHTGKIKSVLQAMLDSGKAKVVTAEQAADVVGEDALYMTAWHGSPHDHDGFSMDKVGTGEGAQAYGHGLYFAGNKDVAKFYSEKLTIGENYVDGSLLDIGNPRHYLAYILDQESGNIEETENSLQSTMLRGGSESIKATSKEALRLLNEGSRPGLEHIKPNGKLYQVELAPSQDDYLLWDKPLSEQSEKVRAALKKAQERGDAELDRVDLSKDDGGWAYTIISTNSGSSHQDSDGDTIRSSNATKASEYLHSLGIRGIKYLDGSSRSRDAGENQFNYVIFNDQDVKITAKFAKDGSAIAFYNPYDGITYFIADHIPQGYTAKEWEGLVLHEISTHALQLGKDSKEFQGILRQVEAMRQAGNKTVVAAFKRVPADTKPEHVTEEALAYLLQESPQLGIVQRVLSWFKNAIRAIGKSFPTLQKLKLHDWASKLSESDLRMMAESALKNSEQEGQRGDGAKFSKQGNTININGTERPRLNSNGKPIANSDEALRNFWEWFSDSAVVDDQGRPLIVYHGSNEVFDTFSMSAKKSWGNSEASKEVINFTSNKEDATGYGKNIISAYLRITNPAYSGTEDIKSHEQNIRARAKNILNELEMANADGIKEIPKAWRKIGIETPLVYKHEDRWSYSIGGKDSDFTFESEQSAYEDAIEEQINEYVGKANEDIDSLHEKAFSFKGIGAVLSEAKNNGKDGAIIEFEADNHAGDISLNHYIVFNSNQIKSSADNNGNFSKSDNSILFSRQRPAQSNDQESLGYGDEPIEISRPSAVPAETPMQGRQRVVQDKFNRFKVLQDWLKSNGMDLSEGADVYLAETLMSGRVSSRTQDFRENQMAPLIKKTQKAGISMEQIGDLLKMQHAPEANERARLLHDDPNAMAYGVSDKEAKEAIATYEARPDFKELKAIADEWRDVTTQSRKILLNAGIISPEMAKSWEDTYSVYIPVKGAKDETGTGKGLSVNGRQKARLGHGLRDEAILENIWRDHERAISLDEKNLVGKALIRFALEAKNDDIITVSKPEKRQVLKAGGHSYMVMLRNNDAAAFDNEIEAERYILNEISKGFSHGLNRSDFSIAKTNNPARVMMQASPMLADNEVNVYVGGHAVRVQINDEIAARAYTNLGVEHLNAVLSAGRSFNNWLSKAYTGWSPDFIFTNPIRDALQGSATLTANYGAGMTAKVFANYPMAVKELFKHFRKPGSSALVTDYRANGGSTGAAYMSDLERIGSDMQDSYNEYAGVFNTYHRTYAKAIMEGRSKTAAHTIASLKSGAAGYKKVPLIGHALKGMERINAITENALRVATYHTLVKNKVSKPLAAAQAKNLMNFNRKGEISNQAGAMFLFFNPNVQGTQVMYQALFEAKHKGQARTLAGMMVLSAFAIAAMNRGGGGDDEERWKDTPGHVKDGNIVFKIPGMDYQFTLTLPYGYRVFHMLGNVLSDYQHGEDGYKLGIRVASGVFANFSPVGNPMEGEHFPFQAMPTVAKMALGPGLNENSFGQSIMPQRFNDAKPDSQLMFRSTKGSVYASAAEKLNESWLSGGTKYRPGNIDVSPETLKFWVRSLTGGAGQAAVDSLSLPAKLASDASTPVREMPVIKRFVREVGISDKRAAFYDKTEEAKKAANEFGEATRHRDAKAMPGIIDKNIALIALSKYADAQQKLITLKRDEVDRIRNDDNLSPLQKEMQTKKIEKEEEGIYSTFIKKFEVDTKAMKEKEAAMN